MKVSAKASDTTVHANWLSNKWMFEGRASWEYVGIHPCRFQGHMDRMLWVHPWPDKHLVLQVPLMHDSRWLTLYGGLIDGSAEWHRSDVRVEVRADGKKLGHKVFLNRPWPARTKLQHTQRHQHVGATYRSRRCAKPPPLYRRTFQPLALVLACTG